MSLSFPEHPVKAHTAALWGLEALKARQSLPILTLSICPTSHLELKVPALGGTCFPARCTGLDETDFEVGWVSEEGTWVLPTPIPYDTEGWLMILYKGFHISSQTYQPAPPAAGV